MFATAAQVCNNDDWKQGIGIFLMLLGFAAIIWAASKF